MKVSEIQIDKVYFFISIKTTPSCLNEYSISFICTVDFAFENLKPDLLVNYTNIYKMVGTVTRVSSPIAIHTLPSFLRANPLFIFRQPCMKFSKRKHERRFCEGISFSLERLEEVILLHATVSLYWWSLTTVARSDSFKVWMLMLQCHSMSVSKSSFSSHRPSISPSSNSSPSFEKSYSGSDSVDTPLWGSPLCISASGRKPWVYLLNGHQKEKTGDSQINNSMTRKVVYNILPGDHIYMLLWKEEDHAFTTEFASQTWYSMKRKTDR